MNSTVHPSSFTVARIPSLSGRLPIRFMIPYGTRMDAGAERGQRGGGRGLDHGAAEAPPVAAGRQPRGHVPVAEADESQVSLVGIRGVGQSGHTCGGGRTL